MEISALLNTAKDHAEKIKEKFPAYASQPGASVTVIASALEDIFTGVTTVGINEDFEPTLISSQQAAVTEMKAVGQTKIDMIVTLKFEDMSIDAESDLDMLLAVSADNYNCAVVTSETEAPKIMELKSAGDSDPFFSGFDDFGEEEAGEEEEQAPEFAEQITIDESNPFYEAPKEDKPPEDVLADNAPAAETVQPEEKATEQPAAASKPEPEEKKNKNTLSKDDLLKQAKKRKKVARANFNFRKKM